MDSTLLLTESRATVTIVDSLLNTAKRVVN